MGVILIIDDEPMSRQTLAKILQLEGYRPITASNGLEALQVIAVIQPDLILLDMMMPQMDGLTFLDSLRSHPWWNTIPIIVLSAITDQMKIEAVRAFNIRSYLVKSRFSMDELLEIIKRDVKPKKEKAKHK